ncbi:hypothetical protein IW140_004346 [Coemansia sp. RSA 1813]|nr:hypothetical protein EV178_004418 [Coemansia sp. RSA 1646]KAJ1768468.1 hypothetical protein LPJ74_004857 [Coemansia sp. RSA 1843]KAJ2087931.1 hypothetical protein IW138_004629 [Coemansia sp. RSA 986]KAJ2212874.1 hypothetical protein EV179_004275 [Coemansia sp. RSA 487]KAJ2567643.1 hypothetical protein IW140_004346 [Coemansia sp. RSA 1813]
MSAINLAGLLIYRISPRKPVEYLLLNDSYEHHRHWYPPKGRLLGNENELKGALRESIDLTGLSTSDLVVDEAFRAELRYVDGIKPKQVVYFLARLAVPSRQGMIRCDGGGMKHQWCSLDHALEKSVFQSMQDILSQAEDYIEGMRDEILGSGYRSRWQSTNEDGVRGSRNNSSSYDDDSNNNSNRYANGRGENGTGMWRTVRGNNVDVESSFKRMSLNDGERETRGFGDRNQQHGQQYGQQQHFAQQRDHHQPGGSGSFRDNAEGSQHRRPQDNPRYKTKLCEKFENDGECPYGHKCVFAHGRDDLRQREITPPAGGAVPRVMADDRMRDYSSSQQPVSPYGRQNQFPDQRSSMPQDQNSATPRFNNNPLYKTRLCQRFADEGSCPYGSKCQFAHGEEELRTAPEQPFQPRTPRDGQFQPRTPVDQVAPGSYSRTVPNQGQNMWRRGPLDSIGERLQVPRMPRNLSWTNTGTRPVNESPSFSDDSSMESPAFHSSAVSPKSVEAGEAEFKGPHAAPLVTPVAQKLPTQEHTSRNGSSANGGGASKGSNNTSPVSQTPPARKPHDQKGGTSRKADVGGNKPWIKVVEVSDKDLKEMGSPLADSGSPDAAKPKPVSKAAELENRLTAELVEFFAKSSGKEPTLHASFKEVTQMEFRNNLTKQQLLNIVIAALFGPCNAKGIAGTIEKNSELLAKIMSKQQDQVFMLNAWQRLLTEDDNAALWQKKASEVLGALYKESLLDEDVFAEWYSARNTRDCAPAIASMKPFAHWLATAEEE